MSQLLRFKYLYFLSIASALSLFMSCNKDISLSLDDVNEDIAVSFIDSFTVNTSTFQLDYMPAASLGTVLVGKINHPGVGEVQSSSYLKVTLDSYTDNIPENAVFDSINVVLKPHATRYYYGDTTQVQSIAVHRVTQEIVLTNLLSSIDSYKAPVYVTGPTIFNNQKFNYNNIALGTGTFRPYINSLDTISVRLDDNFGKEIFDMVNTQDYKVSNTESFQNYLKGIALVPGNSNTAMLGLSDTVNININYTYTGLDGFKKQGKKVITASGSAFQYNNIEYNRAGTPLAGLTPSNRELSATETNNNFYVQAGSGITTKISIPSLNAFMYNDNISVNKAELVIETESVSFGPFPAPTTLMLLVANKNNIPVNYVPAPLSNTVQAAAFVPGNNVGENNKYVFNLIDYVKFVNSNRYIDTDLLISSVSPSIFTTVNTVKIATENGKPKIKLNIVYTKFR